MIDPGEIKVDNNVNSKQKSELINILNEHRDCIAFDIFEIGCTDKLKINIRLRENAVPFRAKPYRLNPDDRAGLDKLITEYRF